MDHPELRGQVVALGASLFTRGLTAGRTGNLSVRVPGGFLVTPTGASLGQLSTDQLSLVDLRAHHLDGPRPSKEAF
ncbi:MAG: class II aldolase/adducin family protein, partial [Actinomycetota bacterium]|nr:class II aldolase/adducin family protein [Actinomycetota bacterium]